MELKIYQIDAFTKKIFSGNPAAVVPLTEWIDDKTMQNIALENNLAETAFFVNKAGTYHIRWFTPTKEVSLCGHATLASAYVIFNHLDTESSAIKFLSKSGLLFVHKENEKITMDFPSVPPGACETPDLIFEALGTDPAIVMSCNNYFVIYNSEEKVTNIQPNFDLLMKLNLQGVIVTAPGKDVDFISRYFAPKFGIPEDPVTGSSHTSLTPYWSKILGKERLTARQLSARGGELICEHKGQRVEISGHAVTYMKGKIRI